MISRELLKMRFIIKIFEISQISPKYLAKFNLPFYEFGL